MMKIMNKLDVNALNMIDGYRFNYTGNSDYFVDTSNFAPSCEVLKEWAAQKSDHLFSLLGEELIVSKKITFEKSENEMSDEIAAMMNVNYADKHGRKAYPFYSQFYGFINNSSFSYHQECCLRQLISFRALASNVYKGYTFEITDPKGKLHKIAHGCKVSRALGRLAEAFGLNNYEDFRICHSQVLNQRILTGTLNLSIHPLDYMTMSDNECHWDSCMSWRNVGSFRQGTVEMMNSPTVLVAYLASDSVSMAIPNRDSNHPASEWNSKKWRSLFVVDKNAIVSVKDYPYHNDNLNKEAMLWLMDLANKNLNWSFNALQEFEYGNKVRSSDSFKDSFYLEFIVGHMYSDFGCLDYHYLALRDKINEKDMQKKHSSYNGEEYYMLNIPYSGREQCMVCGDISHGIDDESFLACNDCLDSHTCDCCGERFGEEGYVVDDSCLCHYCHEDRVHCCAVCDEEHLDYSMTSIVVLPRLNEAQQASLRNEFFYGFWGVPSHVMEVKAEDIDTTEMNYNVENPFARICKNDDCLEDWIKANMLPGKRPHWRIMRWNNALCVFYDELNKEVSSRLALSNESYIDYLNRFISPTPTKAVD